MNIYLPSLFIALGFVLIHFFSKYLSFRIVPLRQFVSFTAGVGISYVFIHLLPQLEHAQTLLNIEMNWTTANWLHYIVYLNALFGVVIFYALDRMIIKAWEVEEKTNPNIIESNLFWAHIGFFALYNAMIGYLLTTQSESNSASLFLFFFAFGLHFMTNDWGLRNHHEKVYDTFGRAILSGSILFGFALGAVFDFQEYVVGLVEAFVTGAMILNVIKHELPSEREGSLKGFLIGVIGSSILFLLL